MNGSEFVVWLVLAVALFVVEVATYQMVCIWFAVGSAVAMVASMAGAPLWLQLLLFLLTSVAVLFLARPLVLKRLSVKKFPTNADLVIGQTGVVKEEINNIQATGRVYANGLDWTARTTSDGEVIPAGSKVRALRIEGVKLIVEPVKEKEEVTV